MTAFVVDASVSLAWVFADEATAATETLLDQLRSDAASVPGLWRLEVANVLAGAERRGRITEAQTTRFALLLESLPITVHDTPPPLAELLSTARRHGLTAYDATYLLLAVDLGLPIATLDAELAGAAERAGVALAL